MAGQAASGISSFIGYALETTAKVFATPTDAIYWGTNTLEPTAQMSQKVVASGQRAGHRVFGTNKIKVGGAIGYPLYGNQGILFLKAALGADTYMTALAADTVKTATPVSTVAGVSTITLTNTGAVTYSVGAWISVNTGANQEIVQINTITGNGAPSTVVTTTGLVKNVAAAAGTAVVQVAQHKFSNIPSTSAGSYNLPTVSIEDNIGRLYAKRYAGLLLNKYALKGGKEDVEVTTNWIGQVPPVEVAAGSATALTPATGEDGDPLYPYQVTNGYIVTKSDQLATGSTSTLQLVPVEEWDVEFDNGLLEKGRWDNSKGMSVWPGTQDCKIKYKYINEALREAEWKDFIDQARTTLSPFFSSNAVNIGTDAAPVWQAYGVYAPQMAFTKASPIKPVGDMIGVQIDCDTIPLAGTLASVFVLNQQTSAY